jgi:hypothetical protein
MGLTCSTIDPVLGRREICIQNVSRKIFLEDTA